MNIRKNTGIQLPTSGNPSLSNTDPIMDSFMEKFSQFLSTNNNQSQFIGNSVTSPNSIFSENFLQKANEFYSQKSINSSLSTSQTSKLIVVVPVGIIFNFFKILRFEQFP